MGERDRQAACKGRIERQHTTTMSTFKSKMVITCSVEGMLSRVLTYRKKMDITYSWSDLKRRAFSWNPARFTIKEISVRKGTVNQLTINLLPLKNVATIISLNVTFVFLTFLLFLFPFELSLVLSRNI